MTEIYISRIMSTSSFFLIILCLLLAQIVVAQNNKLSGVVLNEHGKPVVGATVLLLDQSDSTLVKASITDTLGIFALLISETKAYTLQVSMMGYASEYLKYSNHTIDKSLIFNLKPESKTLQEVNIVSKKPLIEVQGDKLIFNVEENIFTAGLNLFDILDKIPGVVINRQTQTISLQGRSGLLVLIDGRQTYLSEDQLINLLRTYKSEDISKIEMIRNPSSRYDAAGSGGILNIHTKKSLLYGTQYTIVTGGGYSYYSDRGSTPKINTSFALSLRKENYTLTTSVSTNRYSWSQAEQSQSSLYDSLTHNKLEDRHLLDIGRGFGTVSTGRATMDYYLSKKLILGSQIRASFDNNTFDRGFDLSSKSEDSLRMVLTNRQTNTGNKNFSGNLNAKYIFDNNGKEWSMNFDAVHVSDYANSSYLNNNYSELKQTSATSNLINRSTTSSIFSFKTDYVLPINKYFRTELGYKVSLVRTNINYLSDFIINPPTTDFIYSEIINSFYISIGGVLYKKTQYQLGFRGEQTHSEGINQLNQVLVKYNYLNFFPSFNLTHKVNDKHQFTLSYSRRIDRPNYLDLSPFKRFYNTKEYFEGNPLLQPRLNNSFVCNYVYKDFLTVGFQYEEFNRIFINVPVTDMVTMPSQLLIQNKQQNISSGNFKQFGANFNIQKQLTKGWQTSLTTSYLEYTNRFFFENSLVDNRIFFVSFYLSNSFILNKSSSLEISGYYYSPQFYGYNKILSQGALNVSMSKSYLSKKLNIKLSVDDPFNFSRYNFISVTPSTEIYSQSRWDNRQIRLTCTYKFGNLNVKGGNQRSSAEELNRLGSGK